MEHWGLNTYLFDPKTELMRTIEDGRSIGCASPGMALAGEKNDLYVLPHCDHTKHVHKVKKVWGNRNKYKWSQLEGVEMKTHLMYRAVTVAQEEFEHLDC